MITLLGKYGYRNNFIDKDGNELKVIPFSYISKNLPNESFGFFNLGNKKDNEFICYSVYLLSEEEFNEYKNRGRV